MGGLSEVQTSTLHPLKNPRRSDSGSDAIAGEFEVAKSGGIWVAIGEWIAYVAYLLVRGLYWIFFHFTLLHQALERFADPSPVNMLDSVYRNVFIVPYQTQIRIAMWSIQVFGVRLAVVLGVVPLFGIAYAVAFADGISERYIRRASAGRESSGLYHRAKYLQLTAGAFCILLYLCAPWNISALYTLLPFVLLVGLFARLQWKYYKKYL